MRRSGSACSGSSLDESSPFPLGFVQYKNLPYVLLAAGVTVVFVHIMKSDRFQRQIDDEQVEGWKIKRDGDTRVVMYRPNYGSLGAHLIILILTFWTFGTVNVLYAGYKWYKSPQKVVRDEEALENPREELTSESGVSVSDRG